MSKKRMVFPMEVQSGSVIVKIYKVENKGRDSLTVSYFADGKRKLKMFADFHEAHADAKSKAVSLSKGELDVLHLRNATSQTICLFTLSNGTTRAVVSRKSGRR